MNIITWLTELVPALERITHLSGGDPDILAIPLALGVALMFGGVLKGLGLFWGARSWRAGLLLILAGLATVVLGAGYLIAILPPRFP